MALHNDGHDASDIFSGARSPRDELCISFFMRYPDFPDEDELQALRDEIAQVPWQLLQKILEKERIQDKPPCWFTLDESRRIVCELRQGQRASPEASVTDVAKRERLYRDLAASLAACTTPWDGRLAPPNVSLPSISELLNPFRNYFEPQRSSTVATWSARATPPIGTSDDDLVARFPPEILEYFNHPY